MNLVSKLFLLLLVVGISALAALSSTTTRVTYTGNGAVDTYAYTFKIYQESDLEVIVRDTDDDETTLTLTTHYTVSGEGTSAGGNVALVNGSFDWLDSDGDLKTNYKLSIRRKLPITQTTSISNQGAYYPRLHENAFDKLTMISLTQQDEIDRAMKTPWGDTVVDLTLPAVSARAGYFLGFNASGSPIAAASFSSSVAASSYILTLLDDATASEARTTLGHAHTTTGDIEYASGTTTLGRLAAVSAGQVIKSAGVGTAPTYGYPYKSASTTTAISLAVDVTHLEVTGVTTITIPAASAGNAGQTATVCKNDDDFDIVTLGTGVSTTLNTYRECVTITQDGSAWRIVDRRIPSYWKAYTPTGTLTTALTYTGFWKREGDSIRCRVHLAFSGVTDATTLTDIDIPGGGSLSIDTAKILSTSQFVTYLGDGILRDSGTASFPSHIGYKDSQSVQPFWAEVSSTQVRTQQISGTSPFTTASGDTMSFEFLVPVTGWNGI